LGWSYGDKPTFVLTSRDPPRHRDTVEFYSGDLAQFVNGHLRPTFRTIWFVGGGVVSGECLRLGLADEGIWKSGGTGFVRWMAEAKWWRKAVFLMIELLWQGSLPVTAGRWQ